VSKCCDEDPDPDTTCRLDADPDHLFQFAQNGIFFSSPVCGIFHRNTENAMKDEIDLL
jgi:hypothetical protein